MDILNIKTKINEIEDIISLHPNEKFKTISEIQTIKIIEKTGKIIFPKNEIDIYNIVGLTFDTNPKNLVHYTDTITLNVGGNDIYNVNIKLLMECNKVILSGDNEYTILINFPIYLCLTRFYTSVLEFKFKSLSCVKLKVEKKIYDNNIFPHNDIISTISYNTICEKLEVNNTKVNYIINSNHDISGYYISCNITNIKSISVSLFNYNLPMSFFLQKKEVFCCDNASIDKKCININPHTIFVPLDTKKINELVQEERNVLNEVILKNQVVREKFLITIEFFDSEKEFYLSKMYLNYLSYVSDMCGNTFSYKKLQFKELHKNYFPNDKPDVLTMIVSSFKKTQDHYQILPSTLQKLKIYKLYFPLETLPYELKKIHIKSNKHNYFVKVPFGCLLKLG